MREHETAPTGSLATVPAGLRIYAVGDVHGRADLLRQLRDLVAADLNGFSDPSITIFLGDYIDRGPASRQVLEMLVARDWPTPIMALRGNHELAFMSFVDDPSVWVEWQSYGALPTLASYGVDVRALMTSGPSDQAIAAIHDDLVAALPPEHLIFMKDLRDRTAAGDYFFCHAGIRPGVPLEQQSPMDLVTIREPFLSSQEPYGRIIVHGHTPQEAPQVRPNRIGIDTGAYATGRLTALILEDDTRAWLTTGPGNNGRRADP